jgi:hypothetical protein
LPITSASGVNSIAVRGCAQARIISGCIDSSVVRHKSNYRKLLASGPLTFSGCADCSVVRHKSHYAKELQNQTDLAVSPSSGVNSIPLDSYGHDDDLDPRDCVRALHSRSFRRLAESEDPHGTRNPQGFSSSASLVCVVQLAQHAFKRRGWDSNPRMACTIYGFQDRPDRPLRHPSSGYPALSTIARPHQGCPRRRRSVHRRSRPARSRRWAASQPRRAHPRA